MNAAPESPSGSEVHRDAVAVEVTHEALIRHWPKLRGWLEADRAGLRLRQELGEAARAWELNKQDESFLEHRGRRLEDAEALARGGRLSLNAAERAYVGACVALRERARSRRRFWLRTAVAASLATAVVFAGLALWALTERGTANRQTDAANARAAIDLVRRIAAEASSQMTLYREDERGALLALAAWHLDQAGEQAARGEVDAALRTVLSTPYFSRVLPIPYLAPTSVVFSPDSQTLAVGVEGDTIWLWDLRRPGQPPAVLNGRAGGEPNDREWVSSMAFSPDGSLLASGGLDNGTVRLWNLLDLTAPPDVLSGHERGNLSVAFTADGRSLVSGSSYGVILRWDVAPLSSAPEVVRLTDRDDLFGRMAIGPDGQSAVIGSRDGAVRYWDLTRPDQPRLLTPRAGPIQSLAFGPEGKTLAAANFQGTVQYWDFSRSDEALARLSIGEGVVPFRERVVPLAFSPNGRTLVTGGPSDTVRLWNPAEPAEPVALESPGSKIRAVAFSPDGRFFASGGYGGLEGTVRVWDGGQPKGLPAAISDTVEVREVRFSPDGQILAVGDVGGAVRLYDPHHLDADPTILTKHDGPMEKLAFTPDGQTLASVGSDTVRLWDVHRHGARKELVAHDRFVIVDVAFSADSQTLATANRAGVVRVWDLRSSEAPRVLPEWGGNVAFSPEGRILASSGVFSMRLWDLDRPEAEPVVLGNSDYRFGGTAGSEGGVAFSPDGKLLASVGAGGTVWLWNPSRPDAAIGPLRGHEGDVLAVAFSSDERSLASSGVDGTIRLWDRRRPEGAPSVLIGHEGSVNDVAFSQDGLLLASVGQDGKVLLWASSEALADMICTKVWRNLTPDEWQQFVGESVPYEEETCPNPPTGDETPVGAVAASPVAAMPEEASLGP